MTTRDHEQHRGDTVHDHLFVKLFTVAHQTIDSGWNTADVCSGYWRLYQNDQAGATLLLADGTRYPLVPNRVHFVPSWVRFSCHNTTALGHLYVHFDLIGVTSATLRRMFHKPLSVALAGLTRDAAVGVQSQLREQRIGFGLLCQTKALVYAALADLFTRAGQDLLPAAVNPVNAALQHIEHNLGAPMTNAELARLCHYGPDHFVRLFRQHVGLPPAQYILERRVAAATHRLAFTRESIDQIAERLGFANRFHFTKMFTRRMQIGPAAYRKQTRV